MTADSWPIWACILVDCPELVVSRTPHGQYFLATPQETYVKSKPPTERDMLEAMGR